MLAIQRREGRVADAERRRACGCTEGKDVQMQRAKGRHGVGNDLNSGHGVDIGLDRGRDDVVDDDRATRMQTVNHNGHGIRETIITHSIGCCSGTRTGNINHKMGHGLRASARDKTMLDARDNTINTAAAAVEISTPSNTV